MTVPLLQLPRLLAVDANGKPRAGAKMYVYAAGTNNPLTVYQDADFTSLHASPIRANTDGLFPPVYPDPSLGPIKINLMTAADVQVPGYPIDNIPTQLPVSAIDFTSQRTDAEVAANVVPSNFTYLPFDPPRYGAIGDNVADDTAALNNWAAVMNAATAPISAWSVGKTYLSGPITPITADDVTIKMNGSSLIAKPNSWTSATVALSFTGVRTRLYDGNLDGNQSAFSSAVGGCLLGLGNDFQLVNMRLFGSQGDGMDLTGVSHGVAVGCHFDSNAGCGMVLYTCSYLKLSQCTYNFNGYGFQKTFATNTFSSFGLALRFRSHHITFVDCDSLQCGRDGMNVNQGSYAIKFIGCLCWMNDDGGFTVAADSTAPGTPGDAEGPYDLEYIDCEAYNNYGSGLAVYQPAYNITVDGGRYYNNYRAAGMIAQQSSIVNGIYIPTGSIGIRIRAKAYDDRQLVAVTGLVASTILAPGWVPGAMGNYPRVALYSPAVAGAGLAFQGYATITAEASGQVTVAPTAFNGVTMASIVAGWYVTQRTQHNGVFFDNGCQGSADVDGFGQLPGPQAYMGFKTISGYFAANQNILLPAAPLDYTELLSNPTWDSATTGWTYTTPGGGGDSVFTTAGPLLRSPGCLQLIAGTGDAGAQATLIANGLSYVANGAWVEASVWAYATLPNQAKMILIWGAGALNTPVNHPGGGWRQLRIGAYIPPGTSTFTLQVTSIAGSTNYFDSASLRVRNETFDNRDFSYPGRSLPV